MADEGEHTKIIDVDGRQLRRHPLCMVFARDDPGRVIVYTSRMVARFEALEIAASPGGTWLYGLLPPDQDPADLED